MLIEHLNDKVVESETKKMLLLTIYYWDICIGKADAAKDMRSNE